MIYYSLLYYAKHGTKGSRNGVKTVQFRSTQLDVRLVRSLYPGVFAIFLSVFFGNLTSRDYILTEFTSL